MLLGINGSELEFFLKNGDTFFFDGKRFSLNNWLEKR